MTTAEDKKVAIRKSVKLREDGRAAIGNLQDIMGVAKVAIAAGIVPNSMKTEAQVAIAIMTGSELGIGPMFSLRNIYIVNGRACIWGDLGYALVQKSGLIDSYEEGFRGEGDDLVAWVRARRKGQTGEYYAEFSFEDAKRAGLIAKKGDIWKKWLPDMLRWRARWRVLRTGFADCLGGLIFREILSDFPPAEQSKALPREVPLEDFESVSSDPFEVEVEIVDEGELTEEHLIQEHAKLKEQMEKDAAHQAKLDEEGTGEKMPPEAEEPYTGPELQF